MIHTQYLSYASHGLATSLYGELKLTEYNDMYVCIYIVAPTYLNQAVSFSIKMFIDRRFEHFKDCKIFCGTFLAFANNTSYHVTYIR